MITFDIPSFTRKDRLAGVVHRISIVDGVPSCDCWPYVKGGTCKHTEAVQRIVLELQGHEHQIAAVLPGMMRALAHGGGWPKETMR